jgi:5-methylcytosine-specific restriction endonuclease McrA
MNDAEIAKELGVVKGTIYYWRKKLGLPPNAKRGAQRNEKNPVFNAIKNQNWRDPMKNPKTAEKVAQGRLGANNPNWKGGKSNRSIYGRQRLKRLGLLNFCWLCGKKGELHVHHINKNPKDNELSNLIVLCPKCHMKIHKGRIKLEWKSRLESLVPAIELKFPPTSGFKPFQRYFSKESVAHPAN